MKHHQINIIYFITEGAVNLTFNTWKKQTKINKNNK